MTGDFPEVGMGCIILNPIRGAYARFLVLSLRPFRSWTAQSRNKTNDTVGFAAW